MTNPYQPPQAAVRDGIAGPRWRTLSLPGFLASTVLVPLVLVAFGSLPGQAFPAFIAKPGFILALVACAAVSSWLGPTRRSHWIWQAIVTPAITFLLLVALVVLLRAAS